MIRSIPAGGQAAVSKPRASGDDPAGVTATGIAVS